MEASPCCPICRLELFSPDATCPRCGSGGGGDLSAASGPLTALENDRRYEVLETLGRGGMGIVYKVRDCELDELVALKVLDPLFGSAPAAIDRFKHEIKIARRINHPNVGRLYDLFPWRGRLAISMEYIEGLSLDQLLAAGPLPAAAIRRYLRYLCSGLQAAHQMKVVHRDLKPGNILIDGDDRAHILDFGIAHMAGSSSVEATDQVFGTAAYMSPEQAFHPEQVDRRSDIYGLGVVLYRMATGVVPFAGAEAHEVFFAHLRTTPVAPRRLNPQIPAALEKVILRCLEKRPEDRYQQALDVYRDLEALDQPEVVHAPDSLPPVALPPGMRGRALVVDDDALTRAVVGDLLRARGMLVIEARDGYQAIERALHDRPDFILLDLVMPVLDGREALRILKSNKATAAIPVIMLTSLSDPEEAMLSKETGAALFLNKPVEPDVLDLLIEKYGPRRTAERASSSAGDAEE